MWDGLSSPSLRLSFAMQDEAATSNPASDDPIERRAIEAVKHGDAGSYEYLVAKYMKRVVSIAWGIVRNAADAEDLAQEAFVRAFQTIDRFKSGERFGPWIFRIVTNLSLDVMKHRTRFRHEEIGEDEPAARRDRADLAAVTGELARRIDDAIESLPAMAVSGRGIRARGDCGDDGIERGDGAVAFVLGARQTERETGRPL